MLMGIKHHLLVLEKSRRQRKSAIALQRPATTNHFGKDTLQTLIIPRGYTQWGINVSKGMIFVLPQT